MRLSINILTGALALAALSCSKSSTTTTTGTAVSASINGSVFTPVATVGIFSQPDSNYQITSYSVQNNDTTGLNLYFPKDMPINIPEPFGDSVQLVYTNSQTQKSYYGNTLGGRGYITLTALDTTNHKIAGTFSGTLVLQDILTGVSSTDSVVVTNGAFNSSYTSVAY